MSKKIFDYWKQAAVILISCFLLRFLFFEIHPQNNIKSEITANDIRAKTIEIANYLKYNVSKYQMLINLRSNSNLIAEYQKKYGVKEGNIRLSKEEKPYYWEINWLNKNSLSFSSDMDDLKDLNDLIGKLNLTFDLNGNLTGLKFVFPDTSRVRHVPDSTAESIVKDFGSKYLKYAEADSFKLTSKRPDFRREQAQGAPDTVKNRPPKRTPGEGRVDYTFTARYNDALSGSVKRVEVSVTGEKVSLVKLLDFKNEYRAINKKGDIHNIINVLIITAVIILIIILLFKRFRAFEVGFKHGIKIAVFSGLFILGELIISQTGQFSFPILIAMILGPLFFGIGVLIVWSIAESLGREKWKEKFISTDLLLKGYWGNSRIGSSILNGFTLGFVLNVILFGSYFILSKTFSVNFTSLSNEYITDSIGGLNLFFNSVTSTVLMFFTFVLFAVSYFKGKIKDIYLIVLGGLIFGLIYTGFIQPEYFDILIQWIIGIILISFFLRKDILSAFIGFASFRFIIYCQPILFLSSPIYSQSIVIICIPAVLLLLWIIYSLLSKDKALDFDSLTPAYVARITERERLKRELEIAEEVQISFLPEKNPDIKGLEIAARCIPASEVGGDYYDYIEFDNDNLGIIIGDVSGKGIQASFYMTLVKGFVKAVAKQTSSPSEMLNQLNNLFCENVEKGNFITMILARISTKEKKIVFSRAGHNPIIIRKIKEGKTHFYQPNGFALGMEGDAKFKQYIEEESASLEAEDLIVFYTDGITEAMNKQREEFGTERLKKIIDNTDSENPGEIINRILLDVKSFIGKAPQHDDMTLVVVRVKQ